MPLVQAGALAGAETPAAAGTSAVAIGSDASASGSGSIALGMNADASSGGIAIGHNVSAGTPEQIVIGSGAGQVVFPGPVVFNQGGENLVMAWRRVDSSNGLTGGGDFSGDRNIQPVYGTTAGTVCQGNDARFTSAATALANKVNGYPSGVAGTLNIWTGGQAAFDSIVTKNPATVYIVTASVTADLRPAQELGFE
jgi:hypothetical protein